MKKKNRNRTSHKQPAWKRKIQEEIEAFRSDMSILEDLSKEFNVKTRKGRKIKRQYKLQRTKNNGKSKNKTENTGQGTKTQRI